MNITMNSNLSEYNAKIGIEFDKQAAKLKGAREIYLKLG